MTSFKNNHISGWWTRNGSAPELGVQAVKTLINKVNHPVFLLDISGRIGVACDGITTISRNKTTDRTGYPLTAYAPPLPPRNLGDPLFRKKFNLCYAYIVGAMARGITSVDMVEAVSRAGMLGFFGSAGLALDEVEKAINQLQQRLKDLPFGFNLIHSPNEPDLENAIVNLYLKHGIRLISASAYMKLTLPLVYYRVKGIHKDNKGNIIIPNRIIAKASRVEVASSFYLPPPEKILEQLIINNMISKEEAELARSIPMADALTAEADSGGHTDNRPAISLLPTMLALRDKIMEEYHFQTPTFVGLGGGIATPESTAAAFAMGAAYVLTGSINQSCIEAGTSKKVRYMLAEAGQADVTMAPSADMFEMGVKVQTLKWGTMFPAKASKLYELYKRYDRFEDIPEKERLNLEKTFFRCSFQEEWNNTKDFFLTHNPKHIERAETNPKYMMALVFRSYIGRSSSWAVIGEPSRQIDYQIWCGPAMGAFNEWVKGSFLEIPENREVATVATNLLFGACVATRANWIRSQGVALPSGVEKFSPATLSDIKKMLEA